jgi:hypothetical protein
MVAWVKMNAQIEHNFKYHPPRGNAAADHQAVREALKVAAETIDRMVPHGREKATALSKCEEAMMWACAGIARAADPAPVVCNSTH